MESLPRLGKYPLSLVPLPGRYSMPALSDADLGHGRIMEAQGMRLPAGVYSLLLIDYRLKSNGRKYVSLKSLPLNDSRVLCLSLARLQVPRFDHLHHNLRPGSKNSILNTSRLNLPIPIFPFGIVTRPRPNDLSTCIFHPHQLLGGSVGPMSMRVKLPSCADPSPPPT